MFTVEIDCSPYLHLTVVTYLVTKTLIIELRYKVVSRLCELAPAARGDQEARSSHLGPAL